MLKKKKDKMGLRQRFNRFLMNDPQNREELLLLLRRAGQNKIIAPDTLSMLESVTRFSELRARDIMIPRSQMVVISISATLEDIISMVETHQHSRYPVIGESKDTVLGILHAKDLLPYLHNDKTFSLNDLMRPHAVIPESQNLNILLNEFRINRNHMAIVVDEYGGVSGCVTIEDTLEQIVGDIEDEFDNDDESYIKIHKNGAYIIKAHIPLEEFNDYFNRTFNHQHYETLGGMLLKSCEHMPSRGEIVKIENVSFKILNADDRRIKLVEFTNEAD